MSQSVFKLHMTDAEEQEALKTLRCFITLRAYDIISNGQYKKHVIQNKDNCEKWAIDVYTHYQRMMGCLRSVTQLAATVRGGGYDRLAVVCQLLSERHDPPIHINTGWSCCFLTGVRCRNTVHLTHGHLQFEASSGNKRARPPGTVAAKPAGPEVNGVCNKSGSALVSKGGGGGRRRRIRMWSRMWYERCSQQQQQPRGSGLHSRAR